MEKNCNNDLSNSKELMLFEDITDIVPELVEEQP